MIRNFRRGSRIPVLLAAEIAFLLAAGCTALPDGTPPDGAAVRNPSGTERLTGQEAVNRLVTEITVLGYSTGFLPVSEIQTTGEPHRVLKEAAQKLRASGGITGAGGPILTLHGQQQEQQVIVTVKAGDQVYGRCQLRLK